MKKPKITIVPNQTPEYICKKCGYKIIDGVCKCMYLKGKEFKQNSTNVIIPKEVYLDTK